MSPIAQTNRILNRKYSTTRVLYYFIPYFILVYSLIAIYAWYVGIHYIISVNKAWVSLKPISALCFTLSSISMIFHVYQKPRARDFTAGFFNAISISVITAWFENNQTLNIVRNFEEIRGLDPYTFVEGLPSWATIFCFLLFSISYFLEDKRYIGVALIFIPTIAIFGYGLNIPSMFYYKENFSTAMALPTAVLFLHQGLWLYPWNKKYSE